METIKSCGLKRKGIRVNLNANEFRKREGEILRSLLS
jgi:hypothetical protein